MNLIPKTFVVTQQNDSPIIWKHYILAVELYWTKVEFDITKDSVTMNIIENLQYIPVEVLDIHHQRKTKRYWLTKEDQTSLFCKKHSIIYVPLYLQKMICKYHGNV